jgi:hypothetical protein
MIKVINAFYNHNGIKLEIYNEKIPEKFPDSGS